MSVLFKHKDKYDRVAGAYRPVVFYPKPDWDGIHQITTAEFSSGYTFPADGFISVELFGVGADLFINGNMITAWSTNPTYNANNITLPVSAGDVVTAHGSIDGRSMFIPWKLD